MRDRERPKEISMEYKDTETGCQEGKVDGMAVQRKEECRHERSRARLVPGRYIEGRCVRCRTSVGHLLRQWAILLMNY